MYSYRFGDYNGRFLLFLKTLLYLLGEHLISVLPAAVTKKYYCIYRYILVVYRYILYGVRTSYSPTEIALLVLYVLYWELPTVFEIQRSLLRSIYTILYAGYLESIHRWDGLQIVLKREVKLKVNQLKSICFPLWKPICSAAEPGI